MRLKDYILIIPEKDFIYVGYRKGVKISNQNLISEALHDLKKGIDSQEFSNKYNSQQIKQISSKLDEMGFIVHDDYSDYSKSVLERNLYYYERFKESSLIKSHKIENFRVCVIGLGGMGGNIIQMLVSAGVKSFLLIDYDTVDISNLNRQYVYRMEDIGSRKTDVCKEFIKSYDETSEVQTYCVKIKNTNDLAKIVNKNSIDMIIQCADTPSNLNKIVLKICQDFKIPMAYGGVGIDSGFFEVINYEKLETYTIENFYDNNYIPKGSIGVTNSIIASYLTYDILHFAFNESYYSINSKITIKFP